jgi:hypothetical protein
MITARQLAWYGFAAALYTANNLLFEIPGRLVVLRFPLGKAPYYRLDVRPRMTAAAFLSTPDGEIPQTPEREIITLGVKHIPWGRLAAGAWLLSEHVDDDARSLIEAQHEIIRETGFLPEEKPAMFMRALTVLLMSAEPLGPDPGRTPR